MTFFALIVSSRCQLPLQLSSLFVKVFGRYTTPWWYFLHLRNCWFCRWATIRCIFPKTISDLPFNATHLTLDFAGSLIYLTLLKCLYGVIYLERQPMQLFRQTFSKSLINLIVIAEEIIKYVRFSLTKPSFFP